MQLRIKEVAETKKGWSKSELARQIGVTPNLVGYWMNGSSQPNYKNMDKLCKALECSMSDLFIPDYMI